MKEKYLERIPGEIPEYIPGGCSKNIQTTISGEIPEEISDRSDREAPEETPG